MSVISVTKDNFKTEVADSRKTVLADFYADWCGPCRMLRPLVESVADERDDIKVVSINVDDESELAEQFGVFSIPCLIVFRGGAEADRHVGFIPREDIEDLIGE